MGKDTMRKVMAEFAGLSDKALAARRKKRSAPIEDPEHEALESSEIEAKEHADGNEAADEPSGLPAPEGDAPPKAACDCGLPECGEPECKCGRPECTDAEMSDDDEAALLSHYEALGE